VVPVPVDPGGRSGPTRAQARGKGWRTTTRGLFVPAGTNGDLPEQRILEQSMLLPTVGAVTGWAGCRLFGGNFFDGLAGDGSTLLPVPLAIGPGGNIRPQPGIVLCFDRLPLVDVVRRHGIRTVPATRATFDAMRLAPGMRSAVVVLDMAVAARITSIERVAAYTLAHPGLTNIAQLRIALPHAREGSRSPRETRLRLVWCLDAGLPRPEVNCPVHDRESGRLLGIADLLDLEAGLAVEFDGADHRLVGQHTRDVEKDEAFRSRGLELCRVTGPDLRDRALVVRRLLTARRRALFEPPETRAWVGIPVPDSAEREIAERELREALLSELASGS
jgi:hypothetical protein